MRYAYTSGPSQQKITRILESIATTPKDFRELANELHSTEETMRRFLHHLHQTHRIYIAKRFVTTSGPHRKLYQAGDKKDVPELRKATRQEISRRYADKIMADDEMRHRRIMKKRAARFKPTLDEVSSALCRRES